MITRVGSMDRDILLREMPFDLGQLADIESRTALVNYFPRNTLPIDALTILEYYVEQHGQDDATIEQYWEIVNDLRIEKYK